MPNSFLATTVRREYYRRNPAAVSGHKAGVRWVGVPDNQEVDMDGSLIGRRSARLGGLLVVAALFASACGGSSSSTTNTASAPGITATTITIGSHQPLTGPAAPGYSEISPASNAYFQWVNDHGGVLGRKIVYKYEDDGYNPTNTTTITRKQVLQDKVFAIFDALG